jgi:hypothetical protein
MAGPDDLLLAIHATFGLHVPLLRHSAAIGETFPMPHFLRVLHGVLLKGNGMADTWPQL